MNCNELAVLCQVYKGTLEVPVSKKWISGALAKLRNQGLVEVHPENSFDSVITERGEIHLKDLLDVPLPVASWVPGTQQLKEKRDESD